MSKIFATSDLHLGHNRDFVWEKRGFHNVDEMNRALIKNWNEIVNEDDDVYLLGDVMLGNNEVGINLLKQLNGHLHIIIGNHDTSSRIALYKSCMNVLEVEAAKYLKYGKYTFFLTHYPCLTGNGEKHLSECIINLYGHTHQTTPYFEGNPQLYNVGVDAHHCAPVLIDDIIEDLKVRFQNFKNI